MKKRQKDLNLLWKSIDDFFVLKSDFLTKTLQLQDQVVNEHELNFDFWFAKIVLKLKLKNRL